MKIVQSNAISVNGMIARENGDEDWLPSEGWDEFVADVMQYGNFIMGRETYELVMKLYPNYNFDNLECNYKIIVTKNRNFIKPDGYVVVDSPEAAIDILEKIGNEIGLLVGGGRLNSSFYKAGLIDEIWLTVCPTILGEGRSFIGTQGLEVNLKLIDAIKLSKDRVQLKYTVIK